MTVTWPDLKPPSVPVATSEEAAAKVRKKAAHGLYRKILIVLMGCDGSTADMLEGIVGVRGNTLRPRLKELEAAGLILRRGPTALTSSGRRAFVWSVSDRVLRDGLPR